MTVLHNLRVWDHDKQGTATSHQNQLLLFGFKKYSADGWCKRCIGEVKPVEDQVVQRVTITAVRPNLIILIDGISVTRRPNQLDIH